MTSICSFTASMASRSSHFFLFLPNFSSSAPCFATPLLFPLLGGGGGGSLFSVLVSLSTSFLRVFLAWALFGGRAGVTVSIAELLKYRPAAWRYAWQFWKQLWWWAS